MTLIIKETGEEKNLSLRAVEHDNLLPDCFGDLEPSYVDHQEVSEEEYNSLCAYWENEVRDYNSGSISESLGDPSENYTKKFDFYHD